MNKAFFIFAVHNHQPVGNFEHISEEAYSKAYLPFIKTLERHPHIRVVLHYCGILYRFFEKRHPEFLDLLASLVKNGQVDLLTGGFYEPILPILPEVDAVDQVKKMTDFIRKKLNYDPNGIWVAERVWEPSLPGILCKAGVSYTTLDDFHFKLSGLRDEDINGYYITDDGEAVIGIFPGSERLRYLVPFRLPEETIGFLSDNAKRGNVAITMADDGEKFGVWPETYRSVYEEGWLERFFGLLESNKDWIETTTFSDFFRNNPPCGRVYLPTASYREMGEWALPSDAIREYEEVFGRLSDTVGADKAKTLLRGGFWRNFLSKYPESNNLHKKMFHVSRKVHEAIKEFRVHSSEFRKKRSKKTPNSKLKTQNLLNELWMGQCNDAYWHGIFGGLYLPHLRTSVYKHLIKAEAIADSYLHKGDLWLEVEERDIDLDSRLEILIGTSSMNLYIDPEEGGSLFEWDYKPKSLNLMNTFTRREEGYHNKIHLASRDPSELKTIHERITAKEEGLEQFLRYDRYKRVSLLDHFLSPDTSFAGFKEGDYKEQGDFLFFPYSSSIRRNGGILKVSLKRRGNVNGQSLTLGKNITLQSKMQTIEVKYDIKGGEGEPAIFGVEFNLSLSGKGPGRYLQARGYDPSDLANPKEFYGIGDVRMVDEWLGIAVTLRTEPVMDLWCFPLETVSQSEGGFERVYQHSVIFPHWKLDKYQWKGKITLSLENLKL